MRIPFRRYVVLLGHYLRPQWPRMILLAGLMTGAIGLQLWSPHILREFIDTAVARRGASMGGLAALFMTVAVANRIMMAWGRYVGESVGWQATNELRSRLAGHCLELDMAFHKSHTPGEFIERLDGDINLLLNFFSQFVVGVLSNLLLLVGILVALLVENLYVGLVIAGLAVCALFILMRIQQGGIPRWKALRQTSAEFYGFMEERLSATEDIQACGAAAYVLRRFYERLQQWMPINKQAKLSHYRLWRGSLLVFGGLTVAALAAAAILYRSHSITLGTAFLIFNYVTLLERPIEEIRHQFQDLQSAGSAVARVDELLKTESRIRDGSADLPDGPLEVTFAGVSFSYDTGDAVLNDVSFSLRPGRVLGLLGRTGSGKTTLARLLLRLYDPDAGAILLGGVDARTARVQCLRERVGLVTQDVRIFSATVRDNLTLFDHAVPDDRIWSVLEEMGMTDWCRALPGGLDATVGEGGIGLSAGESQLLALARLFFSRPGLVILDEPSSRLDPATEQKVEKAIARLLHQRTGIVIAHRLNTVLHSDEILILEGGRILELGETRRLSADPSTHFSALLRTGLEEMLA